MKTIMMLALLSFSGFATASEVPGDPCYCKTCANNNKCAGSKRDDERQAVVDKLKSPASVQNGSKNKTKSE